MPEGSDWSEVLSHRMLRVEHPRVDVHAGGSRIDRSTLSELELGITFVHAIFQVEATKYYSLVMEVLIKGHRGLL
jgi:hypothetical protein